jgi:hypothetical protein
MASKSASIDTPDIIRDFRKQFITFDHECRRALSGVNSDVNKTVEWLRRDQPSFWKKELRSCEELVRQARSEYLRAKNAPRQVRRPSHIEERAVLEKAERRRDDARKKMEATKRWAGILESKVEKIMGPILSLSSLLDDLTPKAVNRLDRMIESLDEYFRESPGEAAGPLPGAEEGDDGTV